MSSSVLEKRLISVGPSTSWCTNCCDFSCSTVHMCFYTVCDHMYVSETLWLRLHPLYPWSLLNGFGLNLFVYLFVLCFCLSVCLIFLNSFLQVISYPGKAPEEFEGRVGFAHTMPNWNVSLIINNTKETDSGRYLCTAINAETAYTKEVILDVKGKTHTLTHTHRCRDGHPSLEINLVPHMCSNHLRSLS